ncbi:MAG: NAD(P)-dependent oxidoreductase [bacterium]|nr:NAD(P)-dependent oxidoreductase [bacterium]
MSNIILAATKSFIFAAENTELKEELKKIGYEIEFLEDLNSKLSFNPSGVTTVVAGDVFPITKKEMSHFPNLKHIARFGTGFDCVNIKDAKNLGIQVTNIPSVSAHEVAEHALAFIFALSKKLFYYDGAMKQDNWDRSRHDSIAGKKLGVVGLGKIGKELAKLAGSVGMEVVAFDVNYDEEFLEAHKVIKSDLTSLLVESDFVSLHLPLSDTTHNIIDGESISAMKPNSYLINTARGELVDEGALLDAINDGRIAGAGLDVFSNEPPFDDSILNQLVRHQNVIATPHAASFSPKVQFAVARRVLHNILAVRDGRLEEADLVV